nr:hydrogenase maturation nickel metallochaperone HypA [Natronorubrum sediminis]
MAISHSPTDADLRCPECTGTYALQYDSLECPDCGFTPRHGAD